MDVGDELRAKIREIETRPDLTDTEKSRLKQTLMMQQWVQKRNDEKAELETEVTYHKNGAFGCSHYEVGCRIFAECCQKYFTCWRCHDEEELHRIPRREIKTAICMFCFTPQPLSERCASCNQLFGNYLCRKCNLITAAPHPDIYHCDACGICRVGPEENYVHCDTCGVCMEKDFYRKHTCKEGRFCGDCPICGENLFDSQKPTTVTQCGHTMHLKCFLDYTQTGYQCPICAKSIYNMQRYFDLIDESMATHVMPAEYRDMVSSILCNDCGERTRAKYHFIYHKCTLCRSYNTRVLATEKLPKKEEEGGVFVESESDLIAEFGSSGDEDELPRREPDRPNANQPPADDFFS